MSHEPWAGSLTGHTFVTWQLTQGKVEPHHQIFGGGSPFLVSSLSPKDPEVFGERVRDHPFLGHGPRKGKD
jgi:hypothetical protein